MKKLENTHKTGRAIVTSETSSEIAAKLKEISATLIKERYDLYHRHRLKLPQSARYRSVAQNPHG